ncbi:hypothetical protein [Pseudomonas mangiferae]|uniref:Uncharacterized protein n=1 Tax=Pseudomonas mangiferae TaxID=2593654 RepID=A0A553GTU8_9PSED|nr:hypothetical protein [Pseudomonas mangiferae]TRX72909.1 hypothetical protein FM069_20535 [Pseudomonas mangiferae]
MGVITKQSCVLVVAAILAGPWRAWADERPVPEQVVAAMQQDVAARMATFGERIEACRALRRQDTPRLDRATLRGFQLSRDLLIDAIGHLSFRNRDACDREERLELAYALGALESVRRGYGMTDDPLVGDTLAKAVYPDRERQELALRYRGLPENVRAYLERAVGQKPFDLGRVLGQLDL